LALTTGAINELVKAIDYKMNENYEQANESISKLSRMEEEADTLRREMTLELTKGELPALEREELMHLCRSVDWITDWIREAGRILSATPIIKFPSKLGLLGLEMIKKVKECVWMVRKCIDALYYDLNEALKTADIVERLEEDVDEIYSEVRKQYLIADLKEIKVGELILIAQFFDAIENIADWCENTIDQVRVVAIRLL
jgi:predicted phosphate transport protein (TIGR00153 family)